jgi:hypothetical protein
MTANNRVEIRQVTLYGVEHVEVRDSELGGAMIITAGAWTKHEAGLRAEGFREAIAILQAAGLRFEVRDDEEEGNGDAS